MGFGSVCKFLTKIAVPSSCVNKVFGIWDCVFGTLSGLAGAPSTFQRGIWYLYCWLSSEQNGRALSSEETKATTADPQAIRS